MIVVASLVHCAIKKKVIVASQFYDVADVQFTVEYRAARLFFFEAKLVIFGLFSTPLAFLFLKKGQIKFGFF